MDDEEPLDQTPEELAAIYGPDSPHTVAGDFLLALLDDRDFLGAWQRMTPEFRLCRAQAWVWNNRTHPDFAGTDLDAEAASLAEPDSAHDLWHEFAQIELGIFENANPDFVAKGYGAASRPRPIGPDLEIVIFAPTHGEILRIDGPTLLADAITVLMEHRDDGWLVAQIGSDRAPVPGWPPNLYPDAA